jgi:hypothetical protein
MIIDICPRSVRFFVRSCRPQLSDAQFRHVWTMILAIAVTPRGSKLIHLAATVLDGCHRTSMGAFLRRDNWDEQALLNDRVAWLIRRMKPRRGEEIQLIIDDTRVLKRGKQMGCLGKIYEYKTHRYGLGHIIIVGAIRFRGVTMPWRIVLWRPKAVAGTGYLKLTELAAQMVREMPSFGRLRVRVLFDCFYLCPLMVQTCESRRFTWFSVAQRGRRFTRTRGLRKAIGELAPGWIRHEGQRVRQRRARRWANLRVAKVQGHLSRIGHVALVASKRVGDPFKNLVVFATSEHRLAAKTIVSIYEQRWATVRLPGARGRRDRQAPPPVLPVPPHADPPRHGRRRCTSQDGEPRGRSATDEQASREPAHGDPTRSDATVAQGRTPPEVAHEDRALLHGRRSVTVLSLCS